MVAQNQMPRWLAADIQTMVTHGLHYIAITHFAAVQQQVFAAQQFFQTKITHQR